jgi:hypothetical protein
LSDFFSRLVARTIQQADVLLPRPVLHFEQDLRRSTSADGADPGGHYEVQGVMGKQEDPPATGRVDPPAAGEMANSPAAADGVRPNPQRLEPSPRNAAVRESNGATGSLRSQAHRRDRERVQEQDENAPRLKPRVIAGREYPAVDTQTSRTSPPFRAIGRDATPPRITVTIGRIEVKAIHDSTPVHHRPGDLQPKRMSLEEHLKTKRQGNE